jgi:tRNA(Ile)-lysidine synthase
LRVPQGFELRAVHVHHGLSSHADEWAEFCGQYCEAQAVELLIERVRIEPGDPAGVEAAARRERNHVFAALNADFLLTAHHQNDQAETLLLQLLRGSGPKGLAAMGAAQRPSGWRPTQLRPLLTRSRAELLTYAHTHGLAWVDDESNLDLRYRRNALRQQLMPLLETHFPGATSTLARASTLQAEAAELMEDLARLDAHTAIVEDRLDCRALAALSGPRARNLLRYFIGLGGWSMPNARRLNEALHQLLDARSAAQVCVNLGEVELHRFRDGAYLVGVRKHTAQAPQHWQGEPYLDLETVGMRVRFTPTHGAGLKRSLLEAGRVELGLRKGRERMRVVAGGPHRTLKNLLQESAIPPWQRNRLPLLTCDDRLVWASGIGLDADFRAEAAEPGIVLSVVKADLAGGHREA